MTTSMNVGRRTALITALVALLTAVRSQAEPVGPAQKAPVILTLSNNLGPGQSPGPPVYAGIAFFFMNSDGDWVAIELVRQRNCIPAGFNLLGFVDIPGAFACPLTFAGKEWWHAEDLISAGPWQSIPPTPFQVQYVGAGVVPIYFVKLAELTPAITDGVLTIGDLETLPSLQIGYAPKYEMIQHNGNQASSPGHSTTTAHGKLQDGRSFEYQKFDRDNVTISIKISFK